MTEIISASPDETIAIGKQISKYLSPGSVAALYGTLGSGKTYLTKGIAFGLGINEILTSPTFTIINEYKIENYNNSGNCLFLYHIDAYRLNSEKDFEDIGGLEIINSNDICVIEWSERIKNSLPENAIHIEIEITDSQSRRISIKGIDLL